MSLVKELIAEHLFGSFVKLKNKSTGEEVLIERAHWYSIKDGYSRSPGAPPLIEVDAVIPGMVHLWEASRVLHQMSVRRVIDLPDNREWIPQEDK